MKRQIIPVLLLLCSPLMAATWFATTSSANMSAVVWKSGATTTCAGNGSTLSWGSQADGDVFNSNGCTSIAIDVDPGAATGASAGVCGSVTKTVTLTATTGGAAIFTYATAANLVIHANVIGGSAASSHGVTVTGSTNGGTFCGNVTGGSSSNVYGISDSHTLVPVYVVGSIMGGGASGANGYNFTGATGSVNLIGNGSANASTFAASGLVITNAGTATVTGNCIGADANGNFGCAAAGTGTMTITGNLINGKRGLGASGSIRFTPAATNYICMPLTSSYAIGSQDCANGTGLSVADALEIVPDPGVANVKSGTNYGTFTGTLSVGSGGSACVIN